MVMKLCGIHGRDELECGCIIKAYKGGFTVVNAEKCTQNHQSRTFWSCVVCKKEMKKVDLKSHRWSHAY